MSVIEKMSILGIRSFGPDDTNKQVIEFFNPLTLILGPNGTGKTTIIECLRYITTGDMPPGSKGGGAFVHDPKIAHEQRVNAQVRLQFRDILHKQCIVQRSLEATQKPKKVETRTLDGVITRLSPDGQKQSITSRCAEIDQEMISSLGVSKPVLENVIFCHQEDFNWPLSEGKNLKEKFDAIFASTRYVKALDNIRKIKIDKDHCVKEYKAEMKYLKQNKETSQRLQNDLTDTEAKYTASKESVEDVKTQIRPIEEKLDKIYSKASDVNRLNARLGKLDGERNMLTKTVKELEDNITNKFQGSDLELRDALSDFHRLVKEREQNINQIETKKGGLQKKIDMLNQQRSTLDVDIGKQEQEAEVNEDNERQRNALVRQMANEYNLHGFSTADINGEKLKIFSRQISKIITELNDQAKFTKDEFTEREKSIQTKIEQVREQKTRLEQNLRNKQETLSKHKCEIRDINDKLSIMTSCSQRKVLLGKELIRLENELKNTEAAVSVDELKAEINSLQEEKRNLDAKVSYLNSEMSRLHMQSGLQTEINLLKKQKVDKEDSIRRMKARHEDSLHQLLGDNTLENVRGVLDDFIIKRVDEVRQLEKDVQALNNNLSKQDANWRMFTEQLKTKEREKRCMEEKISETCGSEDFDQGLSVLQQRLGDVQDQRGSLLGAEHFFRKYVSDLKREDPCCPLCHREFDTTQEVRELIIELENKLKLVPSKLTQSERDLTDLQVKYETMVQLKPSKLNISVLEGTDIPQLKAKISEATANLNKLKAEIQKKSEELSTKKSEEQLASSIKPDIVMMDRNLAELRDLTKKLDQLSAKLGAGESNRSLDKVNEEKEDTQLILDSVTSNLERKHEKLRNHTEKIHLLKSKVNNLTSEKLKTECDLQQRGQLEETKAVLLADIDGIEEDMKVTKQDLNPLQGNIQSLESEKSKVIQEKEKALENVKNKADVVQKKDSEISTFHMKVTSYNDAGKADMLMESKQRRDTLIQELDNLQSRYHQLSSELETLQKELSNQQVRERELEDNQKLREKRSEILQLNEQWQRISDDIGGIDPIRLERERHSLENKKEGLKNQCMKAEGRQKGYEDEIRRLQNELNSDQYKSAGDKHRDKMIVLRTTEMASDDLGKYYKVLDRAIMDYHSMKMAEINKIIRDLWRKTYRGNDIETIEIRSDEEAEHVIRARRVYNYRVVMLKGDVTMDMRGRCSAGQKVLASLIIRLALAETFCLNCGILALDEPTTNLDRENIESLAFALVEIIKSRSQQRNFRLIVITHDEDFVELLGRSEYVEEFFKIKKNHDGCSVVIRSNVADLHMR